MLFSSKGGPKRTQINVMNEFTVYTIIVCRYWSKISATGEIPTSTNEAYWKVEIKRGNELLKISNRDPPPVIAASNSTFCNDKHFSVTTCAYFASITQAMHASQR